MTTSVAASGDKSRCSQLRIFCKYDIFFSALVCLLVSKQRWVILNQTTYSMWNLLTYWGRVTHACVIELGHHCFRQWLVAFSAPSHYLNQYWLIVNWTTRNKIRWNFNRNSKSFFEEHAFEYVVCKMSAIFSRPQWVEIMILPPGCRHLCPGRQRID